MKGTALNSIFPNIAFSLIIQSKF